MKSGDLLTRTFLVFIIVTNCWSPLRAATFKLTEATIADIEKAMAAGGVTSVELAALYLNRIQVYDRNGIRLNAVAQLNPHLFEDAAAADRLRARGQKVGPLQGLPILVKDSFDVAGLASSAGSSSLKNLICTADAPVVQALKEAGAVILGKSNMWAFAYANDGDRLSRYAWGITLNPYTLESDFGGSSTGSAAATAANFCAFAMGGDTGSSIRLPSSRAALVGGRPSLFLLPGSGIIPTNATLDVIGPMTRTVADNALVMDTVVFDDPAPLDTHFFPPSSKVRPKTYTANLRTTALQGKVIGLPKPYIGKDPVAPATPLDPAIQAMWDSAVQTLQSLGATVKEIDWPFYHNFNPATPPAPGTQGYETVGMSKSQKDDMWQWADAFYLNEHLKAYGYQRIRSVFDLPVQTTDKNDKIAGFQSFVREGKARSYTALGFADYFAAYRRWAKRDVEDVMSAAGVDLLAFPVSGGDDPSNDAYSALNGLAEGSFLGLPQLSVPMGISAAGRPQGMMIMSRSYYSEAEILGFAYAFEQATKARRLPPRTPPLPGETIAYQPSRPDHRREIDPPIIGIQAGIRRIRNSPGSSYRVRGSAADASGVASARVYLNGRQIGIRKSGSWSVRISANRFRRLIPPASKQALVMVLARDIYGNTSARAVNLRVQRGAKASS